MTTKEEKKLRELYRHLSTLHARLLVDVNAVGKLQAEALSLLHNNSDLHKNASEEE